MNKHHAIKITEANAKSILEKYNIHQKAVKRYAHHPVPCYIMGLVGDRNMWRVLDEHEFRLVFMFTDIESDDEFTECVYL